MLKKIRGIFGVVMVLSLIGLGMLQHVGKFLAVGETKEIQILATSDIHNYFYPHTYATDTAYDQGSMARVASVVKQQRAQNPNTILLDNGDTIQDNASALFLEEQTLPMMDALNRLNYDVWTSGNHEYNYGIPLLEKAIDSFKGQFLTANVYRNVVSETTRLKGAKPYEVIERDGVKVAIIGVVTPNITKWDRENLKGYIVTDPLEEIQKAVQQIQTNKEADAIIVSFHASMNGEYEGLTDSAAKIASQVAGIDAIICGHEHAVINKRVPGVDHEVPILEPGKYGDYVSRVTLKMTKTAEGYTIADRANDVTTNNIKTASYPLDEEMITAMEPYHQKALADVQTVIGTLKDGPLVPTAEIKGITQAQIQDTPLIDLILDVQMQQAEKSVSIPDTAYHVSGAGLFTANANVQAGPFKKGDAANVYKFDNTLMTLKVTGKDLKKYMEWSASYYNQFQPGDLTISYNPNVRMYNYDMLAGIQYEIDISQPVGQRIVNAVYQKDQKILADQDIVYLTVNNYRANTTLMSNLLTDGYEVVYDSSTEQLAAVRDMIAQYVQKEGTIYPKVDHNWKLVGYHWHAAQHEVVKKLVNQGDMTIPQSSDGRTPNVRSLTMADVQKEATVVDLVSMNDFHGAVVESGKNIGAAKFATVVKEYKTKNPQTVFLGSGDLYQGSAYSNLTKGKIVSEILKELDMKYSAVGNHEFDWGSQLIPEFAAQGGFEFLAANIVNKNDPSVTPSWAKPYAVIEISGKKIGLVGLITPTTAYQTVPEHVKDVTFLDPVTTGEQWASYLKKEVGVDSVIALTHLSSYQDSGGVITGEGADLAAGAPSIDGVFTAHSHRFVEGQVGQTAIVQGGYNGRGISNLQLVYDKSGKQVGVIPIAQELSSKASQIAPDAAVEQIIQRYEAEIGPILGEVIAQNEQDLNHNTDQQIVTPMGQSTAKMMQKIGKTDLAIMNGGGIRAGLDKGDITVGDMYTIFPFDNTVVTLELSGAEIKKVIEHGIKPSGFRPGQFYGIDVWYEEVAVPTSSPYVSAMSNVNITAMRLPDGSDIKMDHYYTVTTIDFLVAGGDRYDFSQARAVKDSGVPLREEIIKQLRMTGRLHHSYTQNLLLGSPPTDPADPKDELVDVLVGNSTRRLVATGSYTSETLAIALSILAVSSATLYYRRQQKEFH